MDRAAWASYALRLGLAAAFVSAGLDHVLGNHGLVSEGAAFLGLPREPTGAVVSWLELLAGLGFAAGLFLPFDVLVAVGVGVVAFAYHLPRGQVLARDLALAVFALSLLALGPGPAALDARLPQLDRRFGSDRAQRWAALAVPLALAATMALTAVFGVARGYFRVGDAVATGAGPLWLLFPAAAAVLLALGRAPRVAVLLVLAYEVPGHVFVGFDYGRLPLLGAAAFVALSGPPKPAVDDLPASAAQEGGRLVAEQA